MGARKYRFAARQGRVMRHAAVPEGAGAGAGIGTGAREGNDISGSTPSSEPSPGEAPPDEELLDKACDLSRSFLMTSQICRKSCSISGPPSTLSTLASSTGILVLKSRSAL